MGRGLLIIVTGLFVVYGIIQQSLNERQKEITEFSVNYAEKTKAETIANSMADLAFAELNENPDGTDVGQIDTVQILGGVGSVNESVEQPFGSANPFIKDKVLMASGAYEGETVRIEIRARRVQFSRFSYFTVDEPTIWFQTGDVLNGPVHTNGTIHIDGDPEFNGMVTSPNDPEIKSGSDPKFNKGKNFDADSINLPVQVPELADRASDGGLRFNQPINVEFFNDNSTGSDVGKVNISTGSQTGSECVSYNWWGSCTEYRPTYSWDSPVEYNLDDYNGIISSSEDVKVKGTINGNYTLHSEKDVEIKGDVRYHDDPTDNPDDDPSDDYLGIVSEEQTIVDKNAHEYEGSEDLDIHASVMALAESASFTVEGYDDGEERGYLNLFGGLIQYERGPVGLLSGSGYLKNYTYDERFLSQSPRGFPETDQYNFISWKTHYPTEE